MSGRLSLVVTLAVIGCASAPPPRAPSDYPQGAIPLAEPAPERASPESSTDAPEISRSLGTPDSVIVFWPRIVGPRDDATDAKAELRALSQKVQARLADLVRRAAGERRIDARPEPERVCPRAGCRSPSVGVLLARAGAGCAAVALLSGSGTSPARLVPWVGEIRLTREQAPFREPPEASVHVVDYVRCDALVGDTTGDEAVLSAMRAALR